MSISNTHLLKSQNLERLANPQVNVCKKNESYFISTT